MRQVLTFCDPMDKGRPIEVQVSAEQDFKKGTRTQLKDKGPA